MTIEPIGAGSVALYITPADLKAYGLTPQGLTLERALELTQIAFAREGMQLGGTVEIEAFPSSCGVLIFAKVKKRTPTWLSFPDSEVLLAGLTAAGRGASGGRLYHCRGRYFLKLDRDQERTAAILSEFGRREEDGGLLEAQLGEHGREICEKEAVERLRVICGA